METEQNFRRAFREVQISSSMTAADVYEIVLNTHAARFQTTPEIIETALDAYHRADEALFMELMSFYPDGCTLKEAIIYFRDNNNFKKCFVNF